MDGTLSAICYLLAKEHGQFQLLVTSERPQVEYPKDRIEVWKAGQSTRVVTAMLDSDEWKFFQKCEPEEFEEIDLYRNKTIKRRLDREAISRYLRKIGWDIHKRSFWDSGTDATYFEELFKGGKT